MHLVQRQPRSYNITYTVFVNKTLLNLIDFTFSTQVSPKQELRIGLPHWPPGGLVMHQPTGIMAVVKKRLNLVLMLSHKSLVQRLALQILCW